MFQVFDISDRYKDGSYECILIGRNAEGRRRVVRVTDVPQTISVALGDNFNDVEALSRSLNDHLRNAPRACRKFECRCGGGGYGIVREDCPKIMGPVTWDPVLSYTIVSAKGGDVYEKHTRRFATFNLSHPYFIINAVAYLSQIDVGIKAKRFKGTYNVSVTGVESFMYEKSVASFDWVDVAANVISYADLVVVKDPPQLPAPIVTFGFDIETIAPRYINSESESAKYPVGVICFRVDNGAETVAKRTLLLKSAKVSEPDIPDANMLVFDDELEMLREFRHRFMEYDPDIVTGFNTNGFDMPYLMKRAQLLGMRTFDYLSVLGGTKAFYKKGYRETKARGVFNVHVVDCPGRIFVDILPISRDTLSLAGYKLADVAEHYDLDAKGDVTYDQIYPFFHSSAKTRSELVKYCVRDVDLPFEILAASDQIRKLIGKSKVMRIRARDSLDRGLGYVLLTLVRSYMKNNGYMMSRKKSKQMHAAHSEIKGYEKLFNDALEGKKYPGATVFPPEPGVYNDFTVTFDYESLYPNIIRTFNICTTSQVADISEWPAHMLHVSPCGFGYIKPEYHQGIIPLIETTLLNSRAAIRAELATEQDPQKRAMLNAYQLEMKIAANALYGQFGAPTSALCCMSCAYSITSWGCYFIRMTFSNLQNNRDFDIYGVKVRYGDTDSIMVSLTKVTSFEEADAAAVVIRNWINEGSKMLIGSMRMAHEDTCRPFYLLAKKRYIKCLRDKKGGFKLKKSGLGKRGTTLFAAKLQDDILQMGMIRNCTSREIEDRIRDAISDLRMGLVPNSELVHSTCLSKPIASYPIEYAHVRAARQLLHKGIPVNSGDRIKFFYCHFGNSDKKADSVIAADLLEDRKLDYAVYVEETLKVLHQTTPAFIEGHTNAAKKQRLNHIVSDVQGIMPDSYLPIDLESGEIDAFVTKRAKAETVRTPGAPIFTGIKQRQLSAGEFFVIPESAKVEPKSTVKRKPVKCASNSLDAFIDRI